jgi:transposase InsO family protein
LRPHRTVTHGPALRAAPVWPAGGTARTRGEPGRATSALWLSTHPCVAAGARASTSTSSACIGCTARSICRCSGGRRRKSVAVERRPLVEPDRPNQVWSMDFVSDAFEHGRRLKCLTIVDDSASKRSTSSSIMASPASTSLASWTRLRGFHRGRRPCAPIRVPSSPLEPSTSRRANAASSCG